MAKQEIALMAHLMRRAGFGATREELEQLLEDAELDEDQERKVERELTALVVSLENHCHY